jgi:hypothetical protein
VSNLNRENDMSTTRAYYVIEARPDETVDVTLTTEHPLSSYGYPVVLDGNKAIPCQSFGRVLHLYYPDVNEESKALVAKANGRPSPAEERAAFAGLFSD